MEEMLIQQQLKKCSNRKLVRTDWAANTAAPESVNVALAFFGVGFHGIGAVRVYRGSRKATLSSSSWPP